MDNSYIFGSPMKVKPILFSLLKNGDALIAAMLGFLFIQIFTKHSGIGISPDSVTYLSTTRHLLQGAGFRSFDGLPTVDFPLGYPVFLTIISFCTGHDPLQFGPILNGLLFALLIYTCGWMMNHLKNPSPWYRRILLLCIVLSPALQEVYSLLWSETLFLLLILLFMMAMVRYLKYQTRKWLYISAAICAMICVTRYAGVFIVSTGALCILTNKYKSVKNRLMDMILFGVFSVFLLGVNILRNNWLTGTATGPRPPNVTSYIQIMENFGGVIADWLLVNRTPLTGIILCVAVLLIFSLGVIFRYQNRFAGHEFVIALTGLTYCVFMLFTSVLTRYETFTNRLLSPLYIPLLWTVTSWIPPFISQATRSEKWITILTALGFAALLIDVQIRADYEYYDGVKDAGVPGYREDEIRLSPIVQWLEKNHSTFSEQSQIYSNAGDAVYFFTNRTALQLPFIEFPSKVQSYYDQAVYSEKQEYLVWFNNLDNQEMPDLSSILRNKKLILMEKLKDGSIYKAQ